jgi:hypothetical protein
MVSTLEIIKIFIEFKCFLIRAETRHFTKYRNLSNFERLLALGLLPKYLPSSTLLELCQSEPYLSILLRYHHYKGRFIKSSVCVVLII